MDPNKSVFIYLFISIFFVIIEAAIHPQSLGSSRFKRAHQASKEETCTNDASPAENCFDYFTLSLFWSPGYAYKLQNTKNRIRLRDNLSPEWVVHGLWPSMYSKNDPPKRCTRQDLFFDPARLNAGGLKNTLNRFWYTILATNTDTKFWQHEFEKHGSCATRARDIRDDINYFDRTLSLYNSLDLSNTLASENYSPGHTRKLRDIIRIVGNKFGGVRVKVKSFTNKQTNQNYLSEVFVCLDLNLDAINCPNADLPPHVLNKDILYLDRFV